MAKTQALINNIKNILSNNQDGHLSIHECVVLRDLLKLLTEPQ